MKHWIVVLCLISVFLCSPLAQAYNITGSVTGGQSGLPLLKYIVAIPLRLDTANLLSDITVANPFNNHYTLSGLDSGMYIIFSFQDIHQTIPPVPQLDDPRGFWSPDSSGLPSIMNLISDTAGITIQLSPPNSGGFTGRLSYAGTQRGITYIQAFSTATFDTMRGGGLILDTTQNGNGNYTAVTDTFGTYYAYAFMDLNGNFRHDSDEPFGVYGGTTPAPIHVLQSHFPDSINIVMEDPNVISGPARAIPADVSLGAVYPNPFNNLATVTFSVNTAATVDLSLYDVLGRQVSTLAHGSFSPGEHRLSLDGSGLSTGLYFIHLTSSNTRTTRAVILLK
jgi:hypothetical protein